MLYPCSCPVERDGGVARRASLIKQLKAKNDEVLLLDAGSSFAGGNLDQYAQNTQLDMRRTQVNLNAMELMKYDCVAVADEELNFGRKFLEESVSKTKIPFVSSNIKSEKLRPYIIKKIGGVRIGITAVSAIFTPQKADGLKIDQPADGLKKAVSELKEKQTDIIILLSNLNPKDNLLLINEVGGIDVVIESLGRSEKVLNRIDSTFFLRPSWQGRKLGKAVIRLKGGKIEDVTAEELRLSDKTEDDKEIKTMLPVCFADSECKKEGMSAKCQNAGERAASCLFTPANKVDLTIVVPQACRTCDTEGAVKFLKRYLPGLVVSNVYYPGSKAEDMIKKFNIKTLPMYILSKDVEKEKAFNDIKANLEFVNNSYKVKPEVGGLAYFLGRPKKKEQFDVFISLFDKNSGLLLENALEFEPSVHFLVVEQEGGFASQGGPAEVEEALRCVCVKKYQPGFYRNYLKCRVRNIYSSWWDDCLSGADLTQIKSCAKSDEGLGLLRENIELNKELKIMSGPTYLLNNQEIFSSVKPPTKEEFRKIIIGK
jgi:5'-nucleotidase